MAKTIILLLTAALAAANYAVSREYHFLNETVACACEAGLSKLSKMYLTYHLEILFEYALTGRILSKHT